MITAAWLRLLPAPEARLPVVAFHRDPTDGCAAIERVLGTGLQPAALEYLDGGTLAAAGPAFPGGVPEGAGSWCCRRPTARRPRPSASRTSSARRSPTARSGSTPALTTRCRRAVAMARRRLDRGHGAAGGKVSEDIVVPIDRLREAIEETVAIGRRHELEACSWGHAGDGNLHSTFLVAPDDAAGLERARSAAEELFELALRLGGSVSGEHGIGWVKQSGLALQSTEATRSLHEDQARVRPRGPAQSGEEGGTYPVAGHVLRVPLGLDPRQPLAVRPERRLHPGVANLAVEVGVGVAGGDVGDVVAEAAAPRDRRLVVGGVFPEDQRVDDELGVAAGERSVALGHPRDGAAPRDAEHLAERDRLVLAAVAIRSSVSSGRSATYSAVQ